MCKDISIKYAHMLRLTQCPAAATCPEKTLAINRLVLVKKKNYIGGYKFVGESLLAYCLQNYAVDFTIFNIWALCLYIKGVLQIGMRYIKC